MPSEYQHSIGVFLGAGLIALSVGAVDGTSLSKRAFAGPIADSVQTAIRTHPTVEAARDLQRAATHGLRLSRSGLFPSVDARAAAGLARSNNSSTRSRTTRATGGPQSITQNRYESSVTLTQLLYDGYGTRNNVLASQSRVDIAGFQLFDSGEIIGLRAVAAYLDVLLNRRLVELADANAQKHEEVLEQIRTRAEAGGSSMADVDQAAGRVALASSTLLAALNALRDAEAAYLEAVGEAPSDLSVPQTDKGLLQESAGEALVSGVDGNPAVRAAQQNVKALGGDLKATRAPFLPRFDLELDGRRDENTGGVDGPNTDFTAKLVMTYNLYRGGGDTARRRQTRALVAEAQQREGEIRRLVAQAIQVSYNAYQIASDRIPVLEGHVASSTRALAAYYEQFKTGDRTLLDVLNVENEVFGARSNLVNGQFAVLIGYYRILASTGRLLQTLDVAVGLPTGDDDKDAM
ncbi:MAG: TolC family outer membrane protein [Proteobacteria bacterium]|nr:TolC family outer membrane protein [Pseudomonadota bacterium]